MKKNEKNQIKKENVFINKIINYKQPLIMGSSFVGVFILLLIIGMAGKTPPYSNIAVSFGDVSIAWYAIFILTGIIFAAILAFREARFLNINSDHLMDGILIAVPLAVIGSRLYYVIFEPVDSFGAIFNIAGGGLAIHGAVITALVFTVIYTKVRKMNLFAVIDLLAPGFLIGQILGRWGNFFNQEAHGGAMTENAYNVLKYIIPGFILENMNINGTYYHPTFLYESLWNLLGLILILIIRRKKLFKLGDLIGIYLVWYGLGRGLLIEPFRTDPLMIGNIRVNVLFSLTLFAVGGVGYIILKNFIKRDIPYYLDVVNENKKDALEYFKINIFKRSKMKKKDKK